MRNRFTALLLGLVVAAGGVAIAATPAYADACAITRHGYTGYKLCGTGHDDVTWSSGQAETFVIGTDSAIWHIHSSTNGWKKIGGNAKSWAKGFTDTWSHHTVQTVGTDNHHWCTSYIPGSGFNSWHTCDTQSIANKQLGGSCSQYYGCPNPGLWCADFARWVWRNANIKTSGLTAESGSFYTYGSNNGTLHTSSSYKPRVGDAIVFNYHGGGNADHVGFVVTVGSYGVTVEIGGNQSNTVGKRTASGGGVRVGSSLGGQTISAFVSPVYN